MIMKRILWLLVVLLCIGQLASADVITNVDRTRGTAGNRDLIGEFGPDTDPMASPSRLQDGAPVYSDRTYTFVNTPAELVGFEYIMTFNTDKDSKNIMVNYAVTIGEPAVLAIAMDDRIPAEYTTSGGVQVFESQQEAVDLVVHKWAAPGLFADTGLDVFIGGDNDRQMSVYATQEPLAAGTYDFGLHPTDKNFYIIGAVPEPATLALLGLGGLVLRRRKR
jgi:hypothetical protein